MSTATTTQNDDLIILSDNISSTFGTDPVISQDLNFTDNNSIISFDTPMDTQITESPIIEETSTLGEINLNPENNLNLDSQIAFEEPKVESIQEIESIPEVEQVTKDETKELDSSINNLFGDLSFSQDTNSQEITIPQVPTTENTSTNISLELNMEESVGDMNSILNTTIDRLKKRQTGIAGQKSSKSSKINELEAKIKELRDQVTYLKKEIVFLDEENIKIDINIGNLESMKIGKQTKIASKTREHNTKKLTKQIKPE